MKALESLENYCSTKDDKKDTAAFKLPLLKKVDLLYEIHNEIKTLDKKGLNAVKKRIIAVLDLLCNEGAGAMLTRLITKIQEELFAQVDKGRLSQFFDSEISIISASKADPSYKINHLYLVGKIYQRFALSMMTVPNNELITAIGKLLRNHTEWYVKESGLLCIRRIIKAGSSSINTYWNEIFKNLTRNTADKSVEVRLQVAKCYKEAAKVMQSSSLTQFFDAIYQTAIKGFEDDQACVREQYVEALALAMSNKLNEANSPDTPSKVSKKKSADTPKSFVDVYNSFQNPFNRDKNWLKECSVLCIWKVMKYSPVQLKLTKPLALLQLQLTWLSKSSYDAFDTYKSRTRLSWLFCEYTKLLDLPEQIKLKDTIIMNLSKILERSSKGQQQANDQQIILILSAFSSLILELGHHVVEHNSSLSFITDIINPFLAWKGPQVRLAAAECVKALMHRCRTWICQLLSLFLNMATMAHAELAALTPVPLFIGSGESANKENLQTNLMMLNVQSSCLSSLLYCTEDLLHGVPLDIANSALVSAKGIILGHQYRETENLRSSNPRPKDPELLAKKHAGWIIIQGLLGLGMAWVSGNLSTLMKLWNTAFTKETCIFPEEAKVDMETLAEDFIVKAAALKALHDFVTNYKGLMNQQVIRLIATCLVNCSSYLFQSFDKEPKTSIFNLFPTKYLQMKLVTLT